MIWPVLIMAAVVAFGATRTSARSCRPRLASAVTYPGASLALQGEPPGTVLAVPGLRAGTTAEDRAALVRMAHRLGIPVDSIAAVISAESGWRPAAMNPSGGAAGLIQLTTGARLPGFATRAQIQAIAGWSVQRQLAEVVEPYFARLAPRLQGADPGRVYVAVFTPAHLDRPAEHVIFRAPEVAYVANAPAFDPQKTGAITVRGVWECAARRCALATGRA